MNLGAGLFISKLGRSVRALIILGIFLTLLLLFFFFVTRTQTQLLNSLRMQFNAEQERLKAERLQLLNVPGMEREISLLKLKYERLQKRLPDNEATLEIIKQLNEQLAGFDIKLISLVPGIGAAREEGLNETTVEMFMQSGYEMTGRYLEAVEGLPFLFRIKDIAIERSGTGGRLNVRLVLAAYSLK